MGHAVAELVAEDGCCCGRERETLPGEPWGGGLELRLQEHSDADLPPAGARQGENRALYPYAFMPHAVPLLSLGWKQQSRGLQCACQKWDT